MYSGSSPQVKREIASPRFTVSPTLTATPLTVPP